MHLRALLPILAAFSPLAAQAVQGRLVGDATGQPVAGALIVLLGGNGAEHARTATRAGGEFALRAGGPGAYRLAVLRIGYARWESQAFRLAVGETLRFPLSVSEEPIRLAAVTVEQESGCRIRPGGGETVGVLWEEAKKALALAEVTRREQEYLFRAVTTERRLATSLRPLEEPRVTKAGLSSWPFVSLPADSLVRSGFVQDSAGWSIYYGPDVDVLFSDIFLERHCFRLRPGEDAGVVGIAFEPVPGGHRPDIAGVLWLDLKTSALTHFDFTYQNLPDWVPRARAGGRVELDVVPTGAWVIRRWAIRVPVARMAAGSAYELSGYREFTGEVGEILGRDGRVIATYPPHP